MTSQDRETPKKKATKELEELAEELERWTLEEETVRLKAVCMRREIEKKKANGTISSGTTTRNGAQPTTDSTGRTTPTDKPTDTHS